MAQNTPPTPAAPSRIRFGEARPAGENDLTRISADRSSLPGFLKFFILAVTLSFVNRPIPE
jgi:hypothetical protein